MGDGIEMMGRFSIFSIIIFILLSNLLFFFGYASSFALGIFLYSGLLIVFGVFIFGKKLKINKNNFLISFCIFLFIIFHGFIVQNFYGFDYEKFFGSLIILCSIFVASGFMARVLCYADDSAIAFSLKLIFIVVIGIGFISVAGLRVSGANATIKSAFPFTEPSHMALFIAPFFFFLIVSSTNFQKIVYLLVFVSISLLMENLTMLMVSLGAVILILRLRVLIYFIPLCIFIFLNIDLSYYSDRLLFSDTDNLSTLVYIQGWNFIQESFIKTYGFGLGFQQLGFLDISGEASEKILAISNESLNISDGGFVLSKFVSEFGIFSIILLLLYIYIFSHSLKKLRKISAGKIIENNLMTFAMCCIFAYSVNLFIRGVGYFDASMLFLITSIFILKNNNAFQPFSIVH